jgi:hypothetical protein
MQDIIEWCFAVVLFIWGICSFISQFNEKIRKSFGRGLFHLIPNYRFFAPVPIRRDFHLEYRLIKPSLRTTEWRRIQFFSGRTALAILWYPDKRMRKSFNTYVRRIIRTLASSNPKGVKKAVSYLHLVNYLQNRDAVRNSPGFQFRIVSEQTFDEMTRPRLVLISDWHFPIKKDSHE